MKRRTKLEMKWMKEDITEWLLKTSNDPHAAWDEYCKHLVMNNHLRSHYITGKQDFVKVSKELETELKQQQEIKQQKEIIKQNKENAINEIKQLTVNQAKTLWKEYKDKVTPNEKLTLVDLVTQISANEFYLEQKHIELYNKLSLQLA
jgi:uncharacterized protein YeaO (DUF488 family)